MIKRYENFSGKIKLDTQEVIELINVLFELKPTIPDEFPTENLSKLSTNTVTYTSEDDNFKIAVNFQENNLYTDRYGNIITGKYRTIFKVKISKVSNDYRLSDVKDYIKFTSHIIEESYNDVKIKILVDNTKYTPEEFDTLNDTQIDNIIFIIKII